MLQCSSWSLLSQYFITESEVLQQKHALLSFTELQVLVRNAKSGTQRTM